MLSGLQDLGFAGDTPAATVKSVSQSAHSRKTCFRSRVRSRYTRQQYRIRLFQFARAAVRLRPRRAVAYHHEWQTAPLKRVFQSTWPAISRWFISRNNRYRRDDATDSDHP